MDIIISNSIQTIGCKNIHVNKNNNNQRLNTSLSQNVLNSRQVFYY